jgi:hypothetical protein
MPELQFDHATLERQLRRSLRLHLDPMVVELDAPALEARRRARRRTQSMRRRRAILGLAAALALPAAWLAMGAPLPDIPPTAAYQTIIARHAYDVPAYQDLTYDIIAVRVDGKERRLARLPAVFAGSYRVDSIESVSPTGWLAIRVLDADDAAGWLFLDIHDTAAVAPTVSTEYGIDQPIGWGPGDRFAIATDREIAAIDARTGETRTVAKTGTPLQAITWLADGSGFLIGSNESRSDDGSIRPATWVATGLDGTTVDNVSDPDMDLPLPPMGPLGELTTLCPGPFGFHPGCDGDRLLIVERPGTTAQTWLTALEPKRRLAGETFAGDGSLFTLVDDLTVDRRLTLERLTAPDVRERVTSVGAPAGADFIELFGVAPDASMVGLEAFVDGGDHTIVMPTDGRPSTYHVGRLAGYLRTDVADRIAGEPFRSVAGTTAPAVGARPVVRSEAELRADVPNGAVLVVASDAGDPAGHATTRDLGTLTFHHGGGASVSCVGDGTVEVHIADSSYAADCFLGTLQGGSGEWPGPQSVKVVATDGAAWRVVVYDSLPPGSSP